MLWLSFRQRQCASVGLAFQKSSFGRRSNWFSWLTQAAGQSKRMICLLIQSDAQQKSILRLVSGLSRTETRFFRRQRFTQRYFMFDARLVVVGGVADKKEVALKSFPLVIGRGREASLTLGHSLVSRNHCKIFAENGVLQVEDLNSLNGTYVNNQKIDGIQELGPGQLLTLGNVTFRAVYGEQNQQVDQELQSATASASDTDGSGMEYDTDHDRQPIGIQNDTDWVTNVVPESKKDSVSISAIQKIAADQPAAPVEAGEIRLDAGEPSPKVNDAALESFIRKVK